MKLRWLVTKYPEPTLEEVKELSEEHCIPREQARRILKKPSRRELQYYVPPIKGFDGILAQGNWITVPEVIEEVE